MAPPGAAQNPIPTPSGISSRSASTSNGMARRVDKEEVRTLFRKFRRAQFLQDRVLLYVEGDNPLAPVEQLVDALPDVSIIDRSTVNAFDDPEVARAIAATGRRKLIFAGMQGNEYSPMNAFSVSFS